MARQLRRHCPQSPLGLPIGLMLIGRHFDDATLLQLGYAYEQSVDWRKI
jgi:Asp-tRNA(Asn)/Glu-tRNA(Gln) amidotransferase A subunit family amidase